MRVSAPPIILHALVITLATVRASESQPREVPAGIRDYHLRAIEATGATADGAGALRLLRALPPNPDLNGEIAALVRQLGADEFARRESAEAQLLRLGSQALGALEVARSADEREAAARAGRLVARIARQREDLVPALVGAFALIDRDRPAGAVAAVLDALPWLGDPWAQSQGVELLPRIASPADRPALEAALNGAAMEPARIAAIRALGGILAEEELTRLDAYLGADCSPEVQLATVETLADRGYRPVLAVLVRLLQSDDGTTRWRAMNLLEAFSGEDFPGNPYVEKLPAATMQKIERWLREESPKAVLRFPLEELGPAAISGYLASSSGDGVYIFDAVGKRVGKIDCDPYDAQPLPGGRVLVCERNHGRVSIYSMGGKLERQVGELGSPADAEMVSDGHLLVLENGSGKISEIDGAGKRVWGIDGLDNAFDVDRLANGNTLVAESGRGRLVEFDRAGAVVWEKAGLDFPNGVLRLADGRTLYTTYSSGGIVMLSPAGEPLWERVFDGATLYSIAISAGRIHVADGASGRVLILGMDGANSDTVAIDTRFTDIGYLRDE